jgi:hypothetical protein
LCCTNNRSPFLHDMARSTVKRLLPPPCMDGEGRKVGRKEGRKEGAQSAAKGCL